MATEPNIFNELVKKGYSKKDIHALLLKLVQADIKRDEKKKAKQQQQAN